jgi:hypothetical protein
MLKHIPDETSEEEDLFLIKVADNARKLSPAQQAEFDTICAKYCASGNGAEVKGGDQ